jgi:hypothetical protein
VDVGVIGENQRVLPILVLEKVKDAFVLHEPRDEIKDAFLILHAVFPCGISGLEFIFIIGVSQVFENGLDDVRDRLILKNAAVPGHREEPEPGVEVGIIGGKPRMATRLDKAPNDTVKIACSATGKDENDGSAVAHDTLEAEVAVLGEEIEGEVKQPGQMFFAANTGQ